MDHSWNKPPYPGGARRRRGGPFRWWMAAGSSAEGGDAVETGTRSTFGAGLRTLRKDHDLTQEGLAERAGCSWEMVRKIESGLARPSRQLAELLAAALAIPPAE